MRADAVIRTTLEHADGEHTIRISNPGHFTHERLVIAPDVDKIIGDYAHPQGTHSTQPPVSWAAFLYRPNAPTATLQTMPPHGRRKEDQYPLSGALNDHGYKPARDFGRMLVSLENRRASCATWAGENPHSPENYAQVAEGAAMSLGRLQDALSRLLDREVRFEFQHLGEEPHVLFDGDEVRFEFLGEGMRNSLSWLADLLIRLESIEWADPTRSPWDQEFWLLLDEIEESLHPKGQMRVLPVLRSLFPNARLYATTHSPFVVASVGEGHVFSIRPDRKSRQVTGQLTPTKLEHGQSLEWVIASIFDAPTGIIDLDTANALRKHQQHVDRIIRRGITDWDEFFAVRSKLMLLNDEVRAIVGMAEVPIQKTVREKRRETPENGSSGGNDGSDE
ncbi:MAG: ATP-binding protein [Polyangiaceae bacterium]|nr:ATP-binding protein [Polyangiaceae bacterium]